MARGNTLVLTCLAAVLATAPALSAERIATPVNSGRSCVNECQVQHDQCRVATKGSRTCDEARQRCLEICLQKKK